MINRRSLRVKVLQLLFSYFNLIIQKEDKNNLQLEISKQLNKSIIDIEKYYFDIILLSITLKNINQEKKEIAKNELIKKSVTRFNLSNNTVINFLEKNSEIIDGLIKHKNSFNINLEKNVILSSWIAAISPVWHYVGVNVIGLGISKNLKHVKKITKFLK